MTAPLLVGGRCRGGPAGARPDPPFTLNFFRWVLAFAILLPLAQGVLRKDSPVAALAALCTAGPAGHRALQRAAVHGAANLHPHQRDAGGLQHAGVDAGRGGAVLGASVTRQQLLGAVLSITGVLIVLSRGESNQLLALRLVPGDLFMLMATASWSFYSWLLVRTSRAASLRGDWAAFLMAQMVFGLGWSAPSRAWNRVGPRADRLGRALAGRTGLHRRGPAVLAYRCWGVGVQRAGPAVAGFFVNLTPLFAAVLYGGLSWRNTAPVSRRGVRPSSWADRGVIPALSAGAMCSALAR